jgi:hypothetical protein
MIPSTIPAFIEKAFSSFLNLVWAGIMGNFYRPKKGIVINCFGKLLVNSPRRSEEGKI